MIFLEGGAEEGVSNFISSDKEMRFFPSAHPLSTFPPEQLQGRSIT